MSCPHEPTDIHDEYCNDDFAFCKRCRCCSTYLEPCWACDGSGDGRIDCCDDLCQGEEYECMHGELPLPCEECDGHGNFIMCNGRCGADGKHVPEVAR